MPAHTATPSWGQRAFLALETGLNRCFGEQANPLYFLGALAFYLFWLVIFSGLYLYVFFETSVVQAYASVDALTHGQPYAGGMLRSLHRYASDALVLVLMLHMLRHFTFNRHRGFRWFSWVSGVVILWLVYASGVNGYMLPWDRLSQFVVTRTAEWFDVLPVLGGSMARNFISNAQVSDRLFSLLSFIHIGLPLGVMALLWVHTQRVPGARIHPPRALMLGLLLTLCTLSLLQPALSQAPADMATVTSMLAFDWWYLPVYALVAHWGPPQAWLLVIACSALLLALPWLGGRALASERTWTVAIAQENRVIRVRPGETLLDAGLREGLDLPFACRNGGCGLCKCTVLHGDVRLLPYQASALTAAERDAGLTLMCCAQASSDLAISYVPPHDPARQQPQTYQARVTHLELLAHDVMRVCLQIEDAKALRFQPGQYINIALPDGARRSFSFASPYRDGGSVDLHIRRVEGGRFTPGVFDTMRVDDVLHFEGPLGTFTLHEDSTQPIIFVAGSTGFAPVKCMVEHAFQTGMQRQMVLYWGVRSRADLYLADLAAQWARAHSNFRFVPVLSEPAAQDHWDGRTGLVHQAILEDFPDLSGHQVYACGSVRMVQVAQSAFVHHGMLSDACFSDAFHLAAHG